MVVDWLMCVCVCVCVCVCGNVFVVFFLLITIYYTSANITFGENVLSA